MIHASLNALRTLLPVLLTNSYALTIIAIELFEDSVQHSSSSYGLTKVDMILILIDDDEFIYHL